MKGTSHFCRLGGHFVLFLWLGQRCFYCAPANLDTGMPEWCDDGGAWRTAVQCEEGCCCWQAHRFFSLPPPPSLYSTRPLSHLFSSSSPACPRPTSGPRPWLSLGTTSTTPKYIPGRTGFFQPRRSQDIWNTGNFWGYCFIHFFLGGSAGTVEEEAFYVLRETTRPG